MPEHAFLLKISKLLNKLVFKLLKLRKRFHEFIFLNYKRLFIKRLQHCVVKIKNIDDQKIYRNWHYNSIYFNQI